MCFVKSKAAEVAPVVNEPQQQDIVQRKEADASLTKTSQIEEKRGFAQNIKTSALGLQDDASVSQKRLLGE